MLYPFTSVFDVMADAIDRDIQIDQVGGTSVRRVRTNSGDVKHPPNSFRDERQSSKAFRKELNRLARRLDRRMIHIGNYDTVVGADYLY